MKLQNIFANIIAYISVIIILTFRTTIWNKLYYWYEFYGIIILAMVCMIILLKDKIRFKTNFKFLIYAFAIMIYMMLNTYDLKHFFIDFIFIILCIYIISEFLLYYNKNFFIITSNIIFVYACISLFFYVFGSIFKIISPTSYDVINWGTYRIVPSFYKLYYYYQYNVMFNINAVRNSGIFLEAGYYSFFLVYSLIVELFYKDSISKFKVIIFLITTITTFSTAGLLMIIGLLCVKFILNNSDKNIIKFITILLIPLVIIIVIGSYQFILANKLNTNSFKTRINDYTTSIFVFKEKPLIGWGYNNNEIIMGFQDIDIRNGDISGGSNGWMILLYQCGIYMVVVYLIFIILLFLKYLKYNRKFAIIFFIFLITQMVLIPIQYTYIVFYMFVDSMKKELNYYKAIRKD